jgi:hypothetical protein
MPTCGSSCEARDPRTVNAGGQHRRAEHPTSLTLTEEVAAMSMNAKANHPTSRAEDIGRAIEANPDASNRRIARTVGCGEVTVRNWKMKTEHGGHARARMIAPRGTPEFKAWLVAFAKSLGQTQADTIGQALAGFAKQKGFRPPPSR